MPVITLTTEWRPDDIYSGIIKGRICDLSPGTAIIDNASNIPPFNISRASFIIRNTFESYPVGSVHIICVHSEAVKEDNYLIVRARDHYFIGTDNGIFNLILNSEPDEVVKIDNVKGADELAVFARAAADLINGKKLSSIGKPYAKLSEKVPLRATIEKNVIIGSIIFIDSYGNAFSNITREVYNRVFESNECRVLIQSNKNHTEKISEKYCDVPVGDLLARFNSLELLEIANVSELLSFDIGTVVRIDQMTRNTDPRKLF
jgi:S-adenosyl-L-methionine hydrolase (adenosine-forming)